MNIFKRIFTKTNTELMEEVKLTGDAEYYIVDYNDYIDLVHDACSICYNRGVENRTFEDKVQYIHRRGLTGHESIYEHSNFIIQYTCDERLLNEVMDILDINKYLNSKIKIIEDKIFLLLGGSIRGYKHIVRNIEDPNNKVYKAILESMYEMNKCFFGDFIEDNIMQEHKFKLSDIDTQPHYKRIELEKSTIRHMYNLDAIIHKLIEIGSPFNYEDLLSMCTITIHFKDVSRSISQQLVRHRGTGITQASQRYINATNAPFLSPANFKPEKYDKNEKYEINFGNKKHHFTLQELGDEIIKLYPQLVKHGLLKEDARSFLPMNVKTNLYMTFTFLGFIKFLELREEKHAQAEIQLISKELGTEFRKHLNLGEDIFKYLEPKYKKIESELEEEYKSIDEVIE